MEDANVVIEGASVTLRQHRGIGWETVLDQVTREIKMQFKVLGLRLPLRRRVPYSEVVRLTTVCRQSSWKFGGMGGGNGFAFHMAYSLI